MASTTAMPPPGPAPQAVLVDVHTIHAQGGAHDDESMDGTVHSVGARSIGDHVRTVFRNYVLSCMPPHIRRKGLAIPPFRVREHAGRGRWKDRLEQSTARLNPT